MISEQGREIVKICEHKVTLMNRAEHLTKDTQMYLSYIKEISDEQYTILQQLKDLDLKIEYLSQRV